MTNVIRGTALLNFADLVTSPGGDPGALLDDGLAEHEPDGRGAIETHEVKSPTAATIEISAIALMRGIVMKPSRQRISQGSKDAFLGDHRELVAT